MTDQEERDRLAFEVGAHYDQITRHHFEFFLRVANEVHDYAHDQKMSPREVGAIIGVALGSLAKWEALYAPDTDKAIDAYIDFCVAALEVGADQARMEVVDPELKRLNPPSLG